MTRKKAYILAGYKPSAAGYMNYHVGRVLGEHFGYEPVVVRIGSETAEESAFQYPIRYRTVELAELAAAAKSDDIFLPLASAWEYNFGLKLGCRKLLYVQGANTFKVLDGFMDSYVSVSTFVQSTLRHFYGIESDVIRPFIELDRISGNIAWQDRDPANVVIFAKPPPMADSLFVAFMYRLSIRHPGIKPAVRVIQRGVPHADLMALLGRTRYALSLSPIEGFGLVPLEAMASGCTVIGFHGGGGQDYLNSNNSRTTGYPRLDELVDLFAEVFQNSHLAQSLAARGQQDAQQYSRDHFDRDWGNYLRSFGA